MRVNIYSQELLLNADGTHGGLEHGFTPPEQLANGGQRRAS